MKALILLALSLISLSTFANSLDEFARFEASKNLNANGPLLSCGANSTQTEVRSLVEVTKVLSVDDEKVVLITELTNCAYKTIKSHYYYQKDMTSVVEVSRK